MFSMIIFSLILFSLNYNSRVESAIDVIGNYKQLNPKNCGISRLSPQVDTNCFEWHKELLPAMKNARNITIGEAPWAALIMTNASITLKKLNKTVTGMTGCGGALIANQWILTAAHCLVGGLGQIDIDIIYSLEIFFGYDFHYTPSAESLEAEEWFVHPNYNKRELKSDELVLYDIGLIKLKKPINTNTYDIKSENNICLPERRQQFNENESIQVEYGMTAGWSTVEPHFNDSRQRSFRLQMSYWRVIGNTIYSIYANLLYVNKLDNQLICKGDSGSPIWQYYEGRAVIIGIISHGPSSDNRTGCMSEQIDVTNTTVTTEVPFFATHVSTNIDWIMNVTELN